MVREPWQHLSSFGPGRGPFLFVFFSFDFIYLRECVCVQEWEVGEEEADPLLSRERPSQDPRIMTLS